MASEREHSSAENAFHKFTTVADTAIITTEEINDAKSDAGDVSDHFVESKGLSHEDFCKLITLAENGLDV